MTIGISSGNTIRYPTVQTIVIIDINKFITDRHRVALSTLYSHLGCAKLFLGIDKG